MSKQPSMPTKQPTTVPPPTPVTPKIEPAAPPEVETAPLKVPKSQATAEKKEVIEKETPSTTQPAVSPPEATSSDSSKTPVEDTTQHPPAPTKKTRRFRRKNKAKTKTKQTYAHTVYKRRFKQFRVLRLLSSLVGGSIFLLLAFGMWKLHSMVFTTIEDTEHIFLITEKRKTNTIQFQTLDAVRTEWEQKYEATTTAFTKPLFNIPPPTDDSESEGEDA